MPLMEYDYPRNSYLIHDLAHHIMMPDREPAALAAAGVSDRHESAADAVEAVDRVVLAAACHRRADRWVSAMPSRFPYQTRGTPYASKIVSGLTIFND